MILQTQRLFRLGLIDKQGAENVKIHKIDILQRKTYCKITTYLYVNVSYIKASMPTRLFLSKKYIYMHDLQNSLPLLNLKCIHRSAPFRIKAN